MAVGDPIGADLCSVTHDVTGTGFGIVNFVFDTPYNLESGKKYAIVVITTGLDSSNYVKWVQFAGDGYANGLKCISSDAGTSWTQVPTRDLNFTLWSGIDNKDNYSGSGASQAIYGNYHIAQTIIVTSSYSVTKFSTSISSFGNPIGTITASIRKIEGESYTEVPTKAENPAPADAASNVTLDQATITWEDGGGADAYDVYYGEDVAGLTLVSEGQAGLSLTITGITHGSPFDYLVSRTWRIDAINVAGTTTGDVWTFAAIAFDPPLPTGVTLDAEGEPTGTPTGESGMLTIRRLIVAANSKIWYEDI